MKKIILVFIMFIMASVSYADSNVYIVQSGAGLDLDVTLDGNNNSVGGSSEKLYLTGANLGVDIDLIGATNTIIGTGVSGADADYIGAGTANTTDLRIRSTGDSNETKLTAGTSSYALVDTQILINKTGSSAQDSYTVGTTNVVNNAAITVDTVGDDIDITLIENSTSTGDEKVTDINIATDSDDVDINITHTGGGAHDTILTCSGSCAGSDFDISQTGANSTHVDLTVTGVSSGTAVGDVDITITE